ncbi:Uncharacterised protein [uncultured archaeon]|nr:Uncharacterised protein [uncultured archaeon]
MKRIILLGVFISLSVILMINSASAVEYRTVIEYNTNEIISQIENGKINNMPEEWISIFQKMKLKFNNLKTIYDIKILSEKLTELKSTIKNIPQPTCIRLILQFIFSLILAIIGTIFGILFGPILVIVIKLITFPAILLAKIITFIINLITVLIP